MTGGLLWLLGLAGLATWSTRAARGRPGELGFWLPHGPRSDDDQELVQQIQARMRRTQAANRRSGDEATLRATRENAEHELRRIKEGEEYLRQIVRWVRGGAVPPYDQMHRESWGQQLWSRKPVSLAPRDEKRCWVRSGDGISPAGGGSLQEQRDCQPVSCRGKVWGWTDPDGLRAELHVVDCDELGEMVWIHYAPMPPPADLRNAINSYPSTKDQRDERIARLLDPKWRGETWELDRRFDGCRVNGKEVWVGEEELNYCLNLHFKKDNGPALSRIQAERCRRAADSSVGFLMASPHARRQHPDAPPESRVYKVASLQLDEHFRPLDLWPNRPPGMFVRIYGQDKPNALTRGAVSLRTCKRPTITTMDGRTIGVLMPELGGGFTTEMKPLVPKPEIDQLVKLHTVPGREADAYLASVVREHEEAAAEWVREQPGQTSIYLPDLWVEDDGLIPPPKRGEWVVYASGYDQRLVRATGEAHTDGRIEVQFNPNGEPVLVHRKLKAGVYQPVSTWRQRKDVEAYL